MTATDLLALASVVTVPLSVGLGFALLRARTEMHLLRDLTRGMIDPRAKIELAAETKQFSHTLEAVAIEVERISESQRYVTRLLSERTVTERRSADRSHPSPIPPRVVTPH